MSNKKGLGNKGIALIAVVLLAFFIVLLIWPESESEIKLKEKIILGDLELGIGSVNQGEYSLKVLKKTNIGENEIISFEPVTKTYEKIYVTVFNPTSENQAFSSIKLIDNLDNEYNPDSNPDSKVELPDFGRDMIVSPSTARKGYLFFLDIDEKAKTLQLIFELESGEKQTFEFNK